MNESLCNVCALVLWLALHVYTTKCYPLLLSCFIGSCYVCFSKRLSRRISLVVLSLLLSAVLVRIRLPILFFCTLVWNSVCFFFPQLTSVSCGRHGGLMVSALDSRARGPGSSPGWGNCDVFLGKTLYSHSASLHPGV